MATSASAAEIIIDPSVPAGTFGNPDVKCATAEPCEFTDEGTFLTPDGYGIVSLSITTVAAGMGNMSDITNIDFLSVMFNGVAFALAPNAKGETSYLFDQPLEQGKINTLVVNGLSGSDASYSGTFSFAQAAAVPEPTTWMLMLIGMAGVGFSMRRKEKQTLRVRYV
jgi:hypothetical protein